MFSPRGHAGFPHRNAKPRVAAGAKRILMGYRRVGGALVTVLFLTASVRGATPAQIRGAIDKSKAYLYAQQLSDHTWEFDHPLHGDQKTGQTALAIYALLAAGESPQDARLVPAIDYLKKTATTGV